MENLYDLEGKGFVSIWVGDFSSLDDFDEYLAERIEDDHEPTTPINKFSADIGFGFYDHDFQEAEYFGEEKISIRDLLSPFSNSVSFLENAVQSAERLGIETANSAILLFDYQYTQNKVNESAPIKFIGTFNSDRN